MWGFWWLHQELELNYFKYDQRSKGNHKPNSDSKRKYLKERNIKQNWKHNEKSKSTITEMENSRGPNVDLKEEESVTKKIGQFILLSLKNRVNWKRNQISNL